MNVWQERRARILKDYEARGSQAEEKQPREEVLSYNQKTKGYIIDFIWLGALDGHEETPGCILLKI